MTTQLTDNQKAVLEFLIKKAREPQIILTIPDAAQVPLSRIEFLSTLTRLHEYGYIETLRIAADGVRLVLSPTAFTFRQDQQEASQLEKLASRKRLLWEIKKAAVTHVVTFIIGAVMGYLFRYLQMLW